MFSKSYSYKKLKVTKIQASKKYFLIIALASSIIATGVSVFVPRYNERSKFQLPDQVSLSEWRSLSSENLSPLLQNPQESGVAVTDARRYLYTFNPSQIY
jgi:hypothetical protein